MGEIKRDGDTIVPAVMPLLEDEHANVRWHAAFALGSFDGDAQAAIPALQRQMSDDSSPIAAFATEMLRRIDPQADVAPRLIELLQRGQAENRLRALQALSHIANQSLLPALTDAYRNEKNQDVRDRIAGPICQIDARRGATKQSAAP